LKAKFRKHRILLKEEEIISIFVKENFEQRLFYADDTESYTN
jgi:hypothetical protein